jgi:glycosyltransferase involved in cell wall biosynthesis
MRIAFVGPFGLRPKMTMSRRALPLARALAARGHTVRLVLPPWDCPDLSGQTWMDRGVEVINLPVRNAGSIAASVMPAGRLVRCVWRWHPDVIHCFKPKAYAGAAAASFWLLHQAGLWHGRLLVDTDDWEGRGGWNELKRYSRLERWLFAFQERWGVQHCDGVTAASVWLADQVRAMRGGRTTTAYYLPNGVECGCVAQEGRAPGTRPGGAGTAGPRRPTALLYTRFVEHSAADILGIWQRVVERMPEARLLVVGQGFAREEEDLRRLAQECYLDHSMDISGWTQTERLGRPFAEADVAIMPVRDSAVSRAKSPARLLDVMAAGLPVVAHSVGEWIEMLDHGSCGVLVPPLADDAFADEVVRLLTDQGLRRHLGDEARRRACTEYDWHRLAATVEAAYRAVGEVDCPVGE